MRFSTLQGRHFDVNVHVCKPRGVKRKFVLNALCVSPAQKRPIIRCDTTMHSTIACCHCGHLGLIESIAIYFAYTQIITGGN